MFVRSRSEAIADTLDEAKAIFVLKHDGSVVKLDNEAKDTVAEKMRSVSDDVACFSDPTDPASSQDLHELVGQQAAVEIIDQLRDHIALQTQVTAKRSRYTTAYLSLLSGLSMLVNQHPRADAVLARAVVPGGEKEVNRLISDIQRLLVLEKEKKNLGFFKSAWRHQAQKGKL